MELSQIRYFVVLAQMLHFTKAAEACNVSQPALTRAIQKLEQELGGPLFHRERSHTQLTELGQAMRPSLERAYAAAREARMTAEAFRRRETSPLRIGLEYSVPTAVLTPVLSALRRQNTDIELTLRQGSQAELCAHMLAGDIDVALLVDGPDLPDRMHRWDIFSETYVLLMPPEHRLREHDTVALTDLAEECLLLHEDAACPVRRFITDMLEQQNLRPRRQHFANSQEQILEMVQASLGVSLAGDRLPSAAPVLRRPIEAEHASRTVVMAVVAGRQLGPTPSMCVKLMRARAWNPETQARAA